MKKFLLASGVAVLALATVAAAQGYQFSTNLTVGSTGPDVVALQTWLIANGFNIPAISSGAAAKGYFGAQTKSAAQQYQASRSIPSTGFVGPLTRAALNAGGTASSGGVTMVTCPVGFQCIPNGTTQTPVSTPGVISTPGVAGSLALSLQSTPSNGTSVDKGQSADVVRYKFQAGDSDMAVQSLALDFNKRLWLTVGSITLKDDSGNVIGSKSNLTQNDFTEITVGTQYRLRIPLSYVVSRGQSRYVTVNVSMLPVTDQCSSSCSISITRSEVRSVDGTGVTDTQFDTNTRSFTFTGSNNGQIVITVDAASPLKRLVQISTAAETDNVVLGIVDVKSQNKSGTLRSITLYVKANATAAVTSLFSDIKVKAGGQTYSADSISTASPNTTASSTATFTNMTIPLPADQYVPVTVLAKVAKDTSNLLDGAAASTTLVANTTNISVEDATFNTVSVNSGTFVTSDAVFSASSAVLSNLTATLGAPIVTSNTTTGYPVTMSFVLTAGDNTLVISANAGTALATSSTGITTASSSLVVVTANPGTIAGDASDASYYVVPAGSSRQFTWSGSINNTNGTAGTKTFKITSVTYNTSTSGSGSSSINYNLDALKVTPTF